jgi:hypothetical protein
MLQFPSALKNRNQHCMHLTPLSLWLKLSSLIKTRRR